jgi:hypothetical protein
VGRDLTELLARTESALTETAAASLDEVSIHRATRDVRRHRAGRTALRAVGVAAVAAAVGLAGYAGMHAVRTTPPADQPTQQEQPTPQVPDETADVLGLGSLPQATADVLARATAGWALVDWAPSTNPDGSSYDQQANAILLTSPDGTVYHVVDLALDYQLNLEGAYWEPGSTTLDVDGCSEIECSLDHVDLLTGTTTRWDVPESLQVIYWAGWTADGAAVAYADREQLGLLRHDGSWTLLDPGDPSLMNWTVSPSGTHALATDDEAGTWGVVDLDGSGHLDGSMPQGHGCAAAGWIDDTHAAIFCPDGSGIVGPDGTAHATDGGWPIVVDATTGSTAEGGLLDGAMMPLDVTGESVGADGALWFTTTNPAEPVCTQVVGWPADGSAAQTPIDPPFSGIWGAGGDVRYLRADDSCVDTPQPTALWIDSTSGGQARQLIGTAMAADNGWSTTINGVLVGH